MDRPLLRDGSIQNRCIQKSRNEKFGSFQCAVLFPGQKLDLELEKSFASALTKQTQLLSHRFRGATGSLLPLYQAISNRDGDSLLPAIWRPPVERLELRGAGFQQRCLRSEDCEVRTFKGSVINGARPPTLASISVMSPPAVDNDRSSWDVISSSPAAGDSDLYTTDDLETVGEVMADRGDADRSPSESSSDASRDDEKDDTSSELHFSILPHGNFKRNIKYWQKGDFLGSGSFGTVHEGFTDDVFFFAVKDVSLLDQGTRGNQILYQLEQEISLLSQFEHENIVRYLGTDKAFGSDATDAYSSMDATFSSAISANIHWATVLGSAFSSRMHSQRPVPFPTIDLARGLFLLTP